MQDMTQITSEKIRPFIFLIALIVFHTLQHLRPAFKNKLSKRIIANWGIFFTSILSVRVILPAGISGIIFWSQSNGYYLVPLFKLPFYLDLLITVIVFDMLIYWQHRFFHIFNPLWKLHRVHHCDAEMDISTAFRFHPIEIIISAFYKGFFLLLLSPRIEIFIMYEIMLNTFAIFNHSNLNISKKWDGILRKLFVTPAVHFPHHDTSNKLMNMNYGNTLSIWDRIFGTYTDEEVKEFGTKDMAPVDSTSFKKIFLYPFK